MRRKVLYVSQNGLTEPHVVSQVIPYLERLGNKNEFLLVTLEKRDANLKFRQMLAERLENAGIQWRARPYHRAPLGTIRDVILGRWFLRRLVQSFNPAIIHCRSYVPSAMAAPIARRRHTPWIFDMRGFQVEERVDANLLRRNGLAFRFLKWQESRLLESCDAAVVLTRDAERMLQMDPAFAQRPRRIEVVPCCVDLERFRPSATAPATPLPVIAYTGSIGTWYDAPSMAAFFAELRRQRPATLMLASLQPTREWDDALRAELVPEAAVERARLTPSDVPAALRTSRAGLCLVRPSFSKRAASPIKVAEYLASGLPIVVNPGSGDFEAFVERERVGVLVDPNRRQDFPDAAARLWALTDDPETPRRCRGVAQRLFDVDAGARAYERLYEEVAGGLSGEASRGG